MTALQFLVALIARIDLVDAEERPVGSVGMPFFIAHPTAAGTSVREDDSMGLQTGNQLVRTRIIIIGTAVYLARFLCPTIPTIAAVGSVEPHLKQIAILREQLFQLRIEILHVERCAIKRLMAVPWRQIQPEFQSIFLAGSRKGTDDIFFFAILTLRI